MKVLNGHNQVNFTCPIKLPLGKYLGTECTLPVCKKYMHYLHMAFFFKLSNSYLLNLPLFAGVSRVRALSPAWNGSHARETLISRTTSPNNKNQVQYNLDLHFAINISGNSPFGTPALMKNAERYEW
jgi:hypothetical protein